MKASVVRSSRRMPVDAAIAVCRSPSVQTPNASMPCSAATANAARRAPAARPGRARRCRRRSRRGGAAGAGSAKPGCVPGPEAAAARAAARAPRGRRAQRVVVEAVRRGARGVAVVQAQDLDACVVDGRRLRRRRAREARHQRALAHDGHLESARPPAGERESALGDLERALGRRHATPTSTSRKRAGAAPCDTRMSWPGSPLPQLPTPRSSHAGAEQTASRPPQKRGVTPA